MTGGEGGRRRAKEGELGRLNAAERVCGGLKGATGGVSGRAQGKRRSPSVAYNLCQKSVSDVIRLTPSDLLRPRGGRAHQHPPAAPAGEEGPQLLARADRGWCARLRWGPDSLGHCLSCVPHSARAYRAAQSPDVRTSSPLRRLQQSPQVLGQCVPCAACGRLHQVLTG
jgi:hypothetical protein